MKQPRSFYEDTYGSTMLGTAQPSTDAGDETEYPAAVLWMPDPTSRSGWSDRWVKRQKPNAGQKKAGYRL